MKAFAQDVRLCCDSQTAHVGTAGTIRAATRAIRRIRRISRIGAAALLR